MANAEDVVTVVIAASVVDEGSETASLAPTETIVRTTPAKRMYKP